MKPKETAPLLVTLGPILAAAPPLLIGAAIGLGILWLLSDDKKDSKPAKEPDQPPPPAPVEAEPSTPAQPYTQPNAITPPRPPVRRILREDLAEALDYGARRMTRQEAVAALQALGFQKTAAYKALSPDGRFADFLEVSSDGLIEWKG